MTPKRCVEFPMLTYDVDGTGFFCITDSCSSTASYATVEYTSEQGGNSQACFCCLAYFSLTVSQFRG